MNIETEIIDAFLEDITEEEITNCQTATEVLKNYKFEQIKKGITDFENVLISLKLNPFRIETQKVPVIIRPFLNIETEIYNIFEMIVHSKKSLKLLYLHENNQIQKIKSIDKKIIKKHKINFSEYKEFAPENSEIDLVKCYFYIKFHNYFESYDENHFTENKELNEHYASNFFNFVCNINDFYLNIYEIEFQNEFEQLIFEFVYNYSPVTF